MNFIKSLLYGLIVGISEFLPISSQGHQAIFGAVFGFRSPEPLRDILIHIAMLVAVVVANSTYLDRIKREIQLSSLSATRRKHSDRRAAQDLRLIRAAMIPMLMLLFINIFTAKLRFNLGLTALFFVINGVIVYIPEHIGKFSKDANQMSGLDAFLIGITSALSVFPGISRIGCGYSYATARGADGKKAYQWLIALSVVALLVLLLCDIIGIFFTGIGSITFVGFLGYLLSAGGAFAGTVLGMHLMKLVIDRSGYAFFGFYCWGAALLSFLLHLFA